MNPFKVDCHLPLVEEDMVSTSRVLLIQTLRNARPDAFELLADFSPHTLLYFFHVCSSSDPAPICNGTPAQVSTVSLWTLAGCVYECPATVLRGPREQKFAEPKDPGHHSCGFAREFAARN
jgi:hypothetical protein